MDAKLRSNLLRQLEYYYSDLALPFDDFLLAAYKENGNAIPVKTLADSPRIISMLQGQSDEERATSIVEVVAAESDFLRIVEDATPKIARIYPLPDDDEKAPHSAYMGGCPKHLDVDAIKQAMHVSKDANLFGPNVSVRRLRDVQKDRAYSGQLFIECETEEKAAALVTAANKGSCGVICNKAKMLTDFFTSQAKSCLEQRDKIKAKRDRGEKRPREEGDSSSAGAAEETAEAKAAREAAAAAQAADEQKRVLRFEGASESAGREELQAALPDGTAVAWIDFSRGDTSGHVRFESAEGCAAALAALTADGAAIEVGDGCVPKWRLLEEEESKEYWAAYRSQSAAKRQKGGGGKGGKGGKGKGKGGKGKGGRGRGVRQ